MSTLEGHSGKFTADIAFFPQNMLATGSYGELKLWNLNNGECVRTWNDQQVWIHALEALPNRQLAGCSTYGIKIWNIDTGDCVKMLAQGQSTSALRLLSDDRLVSATGNDVFIWSLSSSRCLQTFIGHERAVFALALLPNLNKLASCAEDGTLRIWDLNGACRSVNVNHKVSDHYTAFSHLAALTNGRVASTDESLIKIWDVMTGDCVRTILASGSSFIIAIQPLPGNRLVSISFDDDIKIWNVDNGECLKTIFNLVDEDLISTNAFKVIS